MNARRIRIRPSADDCELTVPADVVEMFGPDAELELKVEPGQVTISRARALPQSERKSSRIRAASATCPGRSRMPSVTRLPRSSLADALRASCRQRALADSLKAAASERAPG